VQELRRQLLPYQDSKIALGVFGALMEVDLINDGPVTFLIDTLA
jgi:D-Tyr-tRNAtyr deacylase